MKNLFGFLISLILMPWMALATPVPQDLHTYPDRMVRVSSVIYDYAQRNAQKVEGVGSVILVKGLSGNRYFVLTAGHVSAGLNLTVETGRHQKYPIKAIHHDIEHDLSLIEIDSAKASNLIPLALYKEGELVAPFYDTRKIDAPGLQYLLVGSKGGDVYPADIADGFSVNQDGETAIAVQAPWLPLQKSYIAQGVDENWMRTSGDALSKMRLQMQGTEQRFLRTASRFAKGQSGTPILIPYAYAHDSFSKYKRYVLSGILTTSVDKAGASVIPGPKIINAFMQEGLAKIGQAASAKPVWFMINGKFVKVTDKLEAYLVTGPVGNGIVIDGFVKQDDLLKERFQQALRERNIPETHVNDLTQQLTEFDKSLANKDQNLPNAALLKRVEEIKSSGVLVH